MQMKFVTQVSSFFSPSTVTGSQTGKSYILFISASFPLQHPARRKKKRGVPFNIHVLQEARPSALMKHE
jgi:hypothetical protein